MSSSLTRPIKYISIEGNIGNGKSTLLRKLSQDPECQHLFVPLYEPLNEWLEIKDDQDRNLLQLYYDDKSRWSYTMQTFAFLTKMRNIKQAMEDIIENDKPRCIIAERSILTDYHIFAKTCFEDGKMSTLEWNIYQNWFQWSYCEYIRKYLNNTQPKFIYLQLDPIESFNRIHKRSRQEEKTIPMEYLQHLHTMHESWLTSAEYEGDVCFIDATVDFENNEEEYQRIKTRIMEFVV
jgi:deoxyadenosine/deoxycytidine kinase